MLQRPQVSSQSFEANTLHPLRERELPQRAEPVHGSVSALAHTAQLLQSCGYLLLLLEAQSGGGT